MSDWDAATYDRVSDPQVDRLRAAGFADDETWLQPWPVGDPPVLDYVRLSVVARRPA